MLQTCKCLTLCSFMQNQICCPVQVDLQSRVVQTLAGNGVKGNDYRGGGKGQNQQLNSPWDVTLDEKVR